MHTEFTSQTPLGKDLCFPKVCIGMPVFNGEKFIRGALDSLLDQTFTDFELIISDNASTDGTEAICREYSAKDNRIRYVRQPENRGGSHLWFLLDEARGEYFMWAACDDIRSRDFIELNYCFLCRNADYIASTSPVRFSGGTFDPFKMGDRSLDGPIEERIAGFLEGWHANGRFYSLFRRKALLSITTLRNETYLGVDWAIVLDLIRLGKFNRCDRGEVVLGTGGISNSLTVFKIHRKKLIHWFFPFKELTCFILMLSKGFTVRNKIKIIARLINLNFIAIIKQLIYEIMLLMKCHCFANR